MTDPIAPKPRGNPAMVKGAASLNPSGGPRTTASDYEVTKAAQTTTAPAGSTGVVAYGGWVQSGEASSALTGASKWLSFTNAKNISIVATALRYVGNLLAGTEWHAEPNPEGGKNAERGADVVRLGLLEAPLRRPWPMIVSKASMYKFDGFSLHATAIARRPDGMVVFSGIEHRPQHTIERWLRDNEESPFTAVEQRTQSGTTYEIPLAECLYCVDELLTDGPEGVGLLRHVIELVRRLGLYETLEGGAYFKDVDGLPIARAPLSEIAAAAQPATPAGIAAAITAATATLQAAVSQRVKTPEKSQWAMLDSSTYKATGTGNDTISTIQKWGIDVVRHDSSMTLDKLNKTIGRIGLEIARVLGIEFAMVGGNDSAGSYGMHEDKTSMFASMLQTTLSEIANFAEQQLARRLVAANGLDPDTCTPKLVAAPLSTDDIEKVTRALANLALAGLSEDDEAWLVLRKRMHLPPRPERSADLMLPPRGRTKPKQPDPAAQPEQPEDMAPVDDKPTTKGRKR